MISLHHQSSFFSSAASPQRPYVFFFLIFYVSLLSPHLLRSVPEDMVAAVCVCVCIFEQLQSSYVTCISVCIGQSVYECVCGCGCVCVRVCVPPSDRPSKSLSQLMSDHSGVLLRALHVIKSGKGAIYAIK